jgi:hypothetical protein
MIGTAGLDLPNREAKGRERREGVDTNGEAGWRAAVADMFVVDGRGSKRGGLGAGGRGSAEACALRA